MNERNNTHNRTHKAEQRLFLNPALRSEFHSLKGKTGWRNKARNERHLEENPSQTVKILQLRMQHSSGQFEHSSSAVLELCRFVRLSMNPALGLRYT